MIEAWVRAWNELDADVRRELLEATFAADGVYVDPDSRLDGRDAVLADIAGFHERRPGARIELRSGVDAFGGWFRFGWAVVDTGGEVLRDGEDFGRFDGDGRIATIVGFFGALPS